MKNDFHHFGVVGCGAWGTALALALRRAGCSLTLWAHDPAVAAAIQKDQENKAYLPGISIEADIKVTPYLEDLTTCDALVIATPAQHLRDVCRKLSPILKKKIPLLIASKGIEQKTSAFLSDVIAEELPKHSIAVLSGPSFAAEVARGYPAALTLAIRDKALGEQLMHAMASASFRLYLSSDIVGAQIGGAIKNVMAVACGIVAGKNLGENARAALITRGLTEMMRLLEALGGQAETLMGLSGLGDLVLTCSSMQSRNMSLGVALGRGEKLSKILESRTSVTEGVYTAAAALALARKYHVDVPIIEAVDAILSHDADIDGTIAGLLMRPLKAER